MAPVQVASAPAPVEKQAEPPQVEPLLPLLTPAQARRIEGYSTAGQQLLGQRLAATREVLERAPDERYAIELFITDNIDPARMERFLRRARDMVALDEVFVIPMGGGAQLRLRVVYGEFESREEALKAERRLPPKYQQVFETSPRSFAELRGQI